MVRRVLEQVSQMIWDRHTQTHTDTQSHTTTHNHTQPHPTSSPALPSLSLPLPTHTHDTHTDTTTTTTTTTTTHHTDRHRLEVTSPEKREVKALKSIAKANSCLTGPRATRRELSLESVCSGPGQAQGKQHESPSTR